jgi:hypothetical protein
MGGSSLPVVVELVPTYLLVCYWLVLDLCSSYQLLAPRSTARSKTGTRPARAESLGRVPSIPRLVHMIV